MLSIKAALAHWLSLRAQIVLGCLVLLIIPLVFIGVITFHNSSKMLEEVAKQQNLQLALTFSNAVRLSLEREQRIIGGLAADPTIIDAARTRQFGRSLEKLASIYRAIGTDYEGLAVFDAAGTIQVDAIDAQRIGISITNRSYYPRIVSGDSGVGEVVSSKATGAPVFVIFAPIRDDAGARIGGVLAVVKANYLTRFVSSFKLGNTGYAVMLNQKGIVIGHPNSAYVLRLDASQVPELKPLISRMTRQETGAEEYTFHGEPKFMGYAPIPLEGGSLGVVQNKAEVLSIAYSNRKFIIVTGLIFFGLAIAGLLWLSRAISTPVQRTLTTLTQAISQAQEAFFMLGLDQKIIFVNPAMATVVGRSATELVGSTLSIDGVSPSRFAEMDTAMRASRGWAGQVTGTRADGTTFALEFSITPVLARNGALLSFLGVVRDITQDILMQSRLRQSEKMEAIGTLAGGIAHDFNNILSAVYGYTELALESGSSTPPETNQEYLRQVLVAAKRARDLVKQILAFSRKTEPARQPMVLRNAVREALSLLRPSIPSTIEIRTTLDSSAQILADPTQINQVLVNLCTNAAYAMRDSGGVLELCVDEPAIPDGEEQVTAQNSSPAYVRLRVSDNGCGIQPELANRVFDPFFTTKPPGEGTGLGLSVVHGIVKGVGGSISVTSEVGRGTAFSLLFPKFRPSDGTDDTAPPTTTLTPSARGERVLLVDDEPSLVKSGTQILEHLGYHVQGFTDGQEALDRFLDDPSAFDVLVTDCTMPQMTGFELANRIRSVRSDIPVILCSGNYELGDGRQQLEGAIYLPKPITTADMSQALRLAITQGRGKSDLPP